MKIDKQIILIVLILAAAIQILIITYNSVTGFIQVTDAVNFLIRLLIGTVFSSIFGLVILYLDFIFINILDKKLPISKSIALRIPLEFLFTVILGLSVGTILTITANIFFPYPKGLQSTIVNNSLITAVINIIVVLIVEAVLWFKRGEEYKLQLEVSERENMQIRFDTLKSQLNPHFLFNSLNVLSSLIRKDSEKAQLFIDEFSSVYRYTLDVIEKPVVELHDELEFAKSYLYLQKIRFDDSIITDINIDAAKLDYFIPPLAIQTLIENTFKHNKATESSPLKIKICNESNFLVIENNLQPRFKKSDSKGVGIANLKKRYELLGLTTPRFFVREDLYIAKVPLMRPE